MTLTTDRLILREIVASDWEEIYRMQNDPEYREFNPWEDQSDEKIKLLVKRFLDWQQENPQKNYQFIIENDDGDFIGSTGIHSVHLKHRDGEFGIRLCPSCWGKGFASEAAQKMLNFGFNELNLHRIAVETIANNLPAIDLCNRLGMKYEGRFREHKRRNGRWYDSLRFAILDHEWQVILNRL